MQSGKLNHGETPPTDPTHGGYDVKPWWGWERCTDRNGNWIGFTESDNYHGMVGGCVGQQEDVDIVASDGSDLCAGVDCGTGEIRLTIRLGGRFIKCMF